MGDLAEKSRISWSRLESTFGELSKTPSTELVPPRTPGAPRKPKYRIRRLGLKPRKLTYEFQSYQQEENTIIGGREDTSRPAVTSVTTSARTKRAGGDKENRPESVTTVAGTPPSEVQPESLRAKLMNWVEKNLHSIRLDEQQN